MDFPSIWVLFLFSILICHLHLTSAQNDFELKSCSGSGNDTQDSAYQRNLNEALFSLIRKNNGFGFYNSTSGQANVVALCRGDIEPESCGRCIEDASRQLQQFCPSGIEAAGWFNSCFLRYSIRSMEYRMDDSFSLSYMINVSDFSYEQVAHFLGRLRQEAAYGGRLRKYASGNITVPGLPTLYGTMQCTPGLSAPQCNDCLTRATCAIPNNRSSTAKAFNPSCIIRYETYKFFNSTWYPAPPVRTLVTY